MFGEMLKSGNFKTYLKEWKNCDELYLAMRENRYKKQFTKEELSWIEDLKDQKSKVYCYFRQYPSYTELWNNGKSGPSDKFLPTY